MATDPDGDVATKIAAASLGWTAGTNLFKSVLRPEGDGIPGRAVFVLASGGPGPQGYADGSGISRRYSSVQVIVRGSPRNFAQAKTDARAVRDALHNEVVSGYIDVRAMQSEPLYIGEDEKGHHMFSVNIELWHEAS